MADKTIEVEDGPVLNMSVCGFYNTVIAAAEYAYRCGEAGDAWEDVAEYIVNALLANTKRMDPN